MHCAHALLKPSPSCTRLNANHSMAQALASQVFGASLLERRTFLEFDLRTPAKTRARSAPPDLHRSTGKTARPKREPRRQEKELDDEAALREGRRQTLCEIWWTLAARCNEAAANEARHRLDAQTLKSRDTLTRSCFAKLVEVMGYEEADVRLLSAAGLIRAGAAEDRVEIWCTNAQLRRPNMKSFLEEAAILRGLWEVSLILVVPSLNAKLLTCYARTTTIASLRKRVRTFCGLPHSHRVVVESMSGQQLSGRTLVEAGLRAGDCLRILV